MTRPLRTAHVSTPLTYRGGENQALLLMRGLRLRGHEAILFSPPGSALAARARAEGIPVVELRLGSELNPFAMFRLAKELRKAQPDVIQMHDGHAVTLGGVAARLAGIRRRVATRRSSYRAGLAWKWKNLAERTVAISATVKDNLVADGVPQESIRVVYSAVNAERLGPADRRESRERLGLVEDARAIFCPAAFTSEKAHDVLLEAFNRVKREMADTVLLLAGEGELEPQMRKLAEELSLGSSVRFLGWREDVAELYAASDLFVMASRYEGLCSSVLEAMWCGLPVVVTDAGGLPEAVGDCGRVVPTGNAEALARAILEALTDRDTTDRLARAAQDRSRKLFSPDAMVEGTLAVYRELMEEIP